MTSATDVGFGGDDAFVARRADSEGVGVADGDFGVFAGFEGDFGGAQRRIDDNPFVVFAAAGEEEGEKYGGEKLFHGLTWIMRVPRSRRLL